MEPLKKIFYWSFAKKRSICWLVAVVLMGRYVSVCSWYVTKNWQPIVAKVFSRNDLSTP